MTYKYTERTVNNPGMYPNTWSLEETARTQEFNNESDLRTVKVLVEMMGTYEHGNCAVTDVHHLLCLESLRAAYEDVIVVLANDT